MTRSRRIAVLALPGLIAVALFLLTIDRVPLPAADEPYFASTAYSLANGGDGVPTILADHPEMVPYPLFYGPVFFRLGAWSFQLFGFSSASFRLVCVLGMVAVALAAALLIAAAARNWTWAAAVFSLLLLSPEAGGIATNGRMDSLVIAFEIAGLAALAESLRRDRARSTWWFAAAAGIAWGLAVLTTPRSLPLLASFAAASPLLLLTWPLRTVAARLAVVGATALALVTVWCRSAGLTPWGWMRYIAIASAGDSSNVAPLLGGVWGVSFTPQAILLPAACVVIALVVVAARGIPPERRTFAWYALLAAGLNVALTFAMLSNAFLRGAYFSLPLAAATLLAAAAVSKGAWPRRLGVLVLLLGLALTGVRVLKYVEVWHSWAARDGRPLEAFLGSHLQPGARVHGYDGFYFYAAARSGADFRSYTPFVPGSWMEKAIAIGRAQGRPPAAAAPADQPRYFIWPVEGFGKDPGLTCGRVVAIFDPLAEAPRSELERLSIFSRFDRFRRYPRSTLYQLPPDCRF